MVCDGELIAVDELKLVISDNESNLKLSAIHFK
jgi:hypothetical protein